MMVIPVKIAAVSTRCAVPMVYGLTHSDRLQSEILYFAPHQVLEALQDGTVDLALVPATALMGVEGLKVVSDFCIAPARKGAAVAAYAEWSVVEDAPVVAVWVAREDADPEMLDAVEEALTLGVERTWEALLSATENPSVEEYDYLTQEIDYLFDAKKHTALEAHWKKLKKEASHANPG